VATALATLLLILVGGLVTTTGSGDSVPDWPLSYGSLWPKMEGGVVYEHTHRLVAALVGLMTLTLAIWTARREPRPGVRRLAWGAFALVVAQGGLGGVRVLIPDQPLVVAVVHGCLAQAFFCVTLALAYASSRDFADAARHDDVAGLRGAAVLTAGLVFVQLVVGALVRHLHAGLAIPTFPLAFGRWVPPLGDPRIAVHFLHRLIAVAVLAAVVWLFLRARRSGAPGFRGAASLALALTLLQIGLGAWTVLSGREVVPTTAHVTVGAAVLGACWTLALRAFRHLRPGPAPRSSAVTAPLASA
jgi:cytochrome c oxidase assembly protein subunit 15